MQAADSDLPSPRLVDTACIPFLRFVSTWMDVVRDEVYKLAEAAIPALVVTFDEQEASRISWREFIEADQQSDSTRIQMKPPWLVYEWGDPVETDEGPVTADCYLWDVSIVIAFARYNVSTGVLKTAEAQRVEAEAAIEAMRAAMRAHPGPYCTFRRHMGGYDAKNAANQVFMQRGLEFHGVIIDATILCGVQ